MIDADKREALRQAKARIAEIMAPKKAADKLARRERRKVSAAARKAAPMKNQRQPRLEDPNYLAWIRGLRCVGCVQDGTPSRSVRSEAAHVRFADARAGWSHTGKGEKPHDRRTLPLCHGHHRDGPKAQHASGERAWWEARNIYAPDLCAALEAAYEAGEDGNAVVRRFATPAGSRNVGEPRGDAQHRAAPNPEGTPNDL